MCLQANFQLLQVISPHVNIHFTRTISRGWVWDILLIEWLFLGSCTSIYKVACSINKHLSGCSSVFLSGKRGVGTKTGKIWNSSQGTCAQIIMRCKCTRRGTMGIRDGEEKRALSASDSGKLGRLQRRSGSWAEGLRELGTEWAKKDREDRQYRRVHSHQQGSMLEHLP